MPWSSYPRKPAACPSPSQGLPREQQGILQGLSFFRTWSWWRAMMQKDCHSGVSDVGGASPHPVRGWKKLTALHVQELESPWRNKGKKTEYLTREFPREQNSKFPFWSSSSVNVHMLPHVYKLYKCLHDTIKLCSLPSLYLYYKVLFQKKRKNKKAKYLVQRTNYKGQILYYNAQKWGQVV